MQLPNPAHSTPTPLPAPHPNPPFNLAFYLIFRLELLCWIERIICRTSPLRGRKSWQAEEPILIKQHKKTLLPSVSIRRTRFFSIVMSAELAAEQSDVRELLTTLNLWNSNGILFCLVWFDDRECMHARGILLLLLLLPVLLSQILWSLISGTDLYSLSCLWKIKWTSHYILTGVLTV